MDIHITRNSMPNNDIVNGFDEEKSKTLKITLEKAYGDILLIDLDGTIDTYNSTFFQKKIQKTIDSGFVKLVFRCGKLKTVSSTGIGSFSFFLKTIKPRGGDMVLLELPQEVREVFHVLSVYDCFTIIDNYEEAMEYLNAAPSNEQNGFTPKIIACPVCKRKMKAKSPGQFRCAGCMAVITIGKNGQVSLG